MQSTFLYRFSIFAGSIRVLNGQKYTGPHELVSTKMKADTLFALVGALKADTLETAKPNAADTFIQRHIVPYYADAPLQKKKTVKEDQ